MRTDSLSQNRQSSQRTVHHSEGDPPSRTSGLDALQRLAEHSAPGRDSCNKLSENRASWPREQVPYQHRSCPLGQL